VIYKGVEYSVTATSESDIWQWRFQIGDLTTSGRTRTRLGPYGSAPRTHEIDAALRVSDPATQDGGLEA
jgi:hypothetical protein